MASVAPSEATETGSMPSNTGEVIALAPPKSTKEAKRPPDERSRWAENAAPENLGYHSFAPSLSRQYPESSAFSESNEPFFDAKQHGYTQKPIDGPVVIGIPSIIDTSTNGTDAATFRGPTANYLEPFDNNSPQTNSSSNHTDDSVHSRAVDGAFSYASTNSSNSSTAFLDTSIKPEPEDPDAFVRMADNRTPPVSSLQSEMPVPKPVTLDTTSPSVPPSAKRRKISNEVKLRVTDFKPRSALPHDISHQELARQSLEAALSSRLNPFVLHPAEYALIKDHICHLHVTAYLNIRNRILRLWVRNPLVAITAEEAAGCALGTKWLGLAEVAYDWLVRSGYINFGCVEVPSLISGQRRKSKTPRETVVVVGAGMSGLGCARQLEGLFNHFSDRWTSLGQDPPRVVLVEGRSRIGGRIYSHPLQHQVSKRIPKHLRCTAELGAHIITGFDRGNPLNMIIRGQLALHYYPLKDNSSLYDVDGRVVNLDHDRLVEKLFNDILERASAYRHKHPTPQTVEGDRSMIEAGKDPTGETGKTISEVEEEENAVINQPANLEDKGLQQVPAGLDKLTRKSVLVPGSRSKMPAAEAAESMGWQLASPDFAGRDIDLDSIANGNQYPTLGQAMDEAIRQYQALLNLAPQDLRLLNWHFANLEYANAANVGKLSLGGWDQDIGNEFEGEHAQVIGGYIQVPRGLFQSPYPMDLRTRRTVSKIIYDSLNGSNSLGKVVCSDGETIEANHIVLTTPLGVLKQRSITFEPELPAWKTDSIERLGFGVLNKVILAYERPFWDVDQDMIGLLRDTDVPDSEKQDDYSANRGRFYLFWNCIKTAGRPLLIALMAGDAAIQAESVSDGQIVAEVQHQLCRMFRHKAIPSPMETIVTRWGQDPFARGTYSYVSPNAHSNDYDSMAKPVGNLHFAGEATCGTHPATVHGAYISGLRAASEVIGSMLGPIPIPQPFIRNPPPKPEPVPGDPTRSSKAPQTQSRGDDSLIPGETQTAKQARLEAFEAEILQAIFAEIGPRPDKPGKMGANPFLLFSKDKWSECKAKCDNARRAALGNPDAKASRNEIRAALGLMWREAPEEVKRPYLQRTVENKASNHDNAATFQSRLTAWDNQAIAIRKNYIEGHPGVLSQREEEEMWHALGVYGGQDRKAKKISGYAEGVGSADAA